MTVVYLRFQESGQLFWIRWFFIFICLCCSNGLKVLQTSSNISESRQLQKRNSVTNPFERAAQNRQLGDGIFRQGFGPPGQFFPQPQSVSGEISSFSDARIELATGAELFAVPGQLVNLIFVLMNLGEPRYFFISVSEVNSGFQNDQAQFLNGLSDQRPFLRRNESRNLILSLRIPQNTFIGANKTISIEAQAQGFSGTTSVVRRFFFSIDAQRADFFDRYGPYCEVLDDTRNSQCSDVLNNPVNCRQKQWSGRFLFQDYDSGLKSLYGKERFDFNVFDVFFSHTNFIIGTKLQTYYSFRVSCCTNSYSVTGVDLAGNEEICVAGEGATVRFGPVQITIIIVVLVLIFIVIVSIAYVIRRKKRNSELAKLGFLQKQPQLQPQSQQQQQHQQQQR